MENLTIEQCKILRGLVKKAIIETDRIIKNSPIELYPVDIFRDVAIKTNPKFKEILVILENDIKEKER